VHPHELGTELGGGGQIGERSGTNEQSGHAGVVPRAG
jgi:hypothetical protein